MSSPDEILKFLSEHNLDELEAELIIFAKTRHLEEFIERHKTVAIDQIKTIIPRCKQNNLSMGDTFHNILVFIEKGILKESPALLNRSIGVIRDWVIKLSQYGLISILPSRSKPDKETKEKMKNSLIEKLEAAIPTLIQKTVFHRAKPELIPEAVTIQFDLANMYKYFDIIYEEAWSYSNPQTITIWGSMVSEERLKEFLDEEKQIKEEFILSTMTFFVDAFPLRLNNKINEICGELLTLLTTRSLTFDKETRQAMQTDVAAIMMENYKREIDKIFKPEVSSGRRAGTGTYSNRNELLKAISKAASELKQKGKIVSKESVAKKMGKDRQALNRLLQKFKLDNIKWEALISS